MTIRSLRLRLHCLGREDRPLNPRLRQELRQRNEAVMRSKLEQRKQAWEQWEEEAERRETERRQRRLQGGVSPPASAVGAAPPATQVPQPVRGWEQPAQVQDWAAAQPQALPQQPAASPVRSWGRVEQDQGLPPGAPRQPPPVPPRLRQEQQQAFVAANQDVERQVEARERQLADLQASLQQRVAQRRRQAGRWMGAGTQAAQQQAQQQAAQQAVQPPDVSPSPDLGLFARSGLQRKVSRFAELANAVRRDQDARGAGLSWGRRQGPAGSPPARTRQGKSGWEEALDVTRVQRGALPQQGRAAAQPGGTSGSAAGEPQQRRESAGPVQEQPGEGWDQQQLQLQEQQQQQQQMWQPPLWPQRQPGQGSGLSGAPPAELLVDDGSLDW